MFNFAEVNESLRNYRQERKAGDEQKALDLISRGHELYGEEFWQNFMSLSGDIDGFSSLLGISKQKIAGWRQKIKKYLTKYYSSTDDLDEKPNKRRLIRAKDYEEE
jgi:hypothetical protein